jgi:hypothetical protein
MHQSEGWNQPTIARVVTARSYLPAVTRHSTPPASAGCDQAAGAVLASSSAGAVRSQDG